MIVAPRSLPNRGAGSTPRSATLDVKGKRPRQPRLQIWTKS